MAENLIQSIINLSSIPKNCILSSFTWVFSSPEHKRRYFEECW